MAALAVAAVALVVAGCGGGGGGGGGGKNAQTTPPSNAKKGGSLTELYAGDVDYIDPGQTYYQYGFNVAYATQRPLFSFKPSSTQAVPDLASGPAQITDGGKTVTIHIRKGIRFSPPWNKEVTSADVKYAIERGFLTTVPNGYATIYFSDIVGAPTKPIPHHRSFAGIQTPDRYTVVFKLKRPTGRVVVGALALPLSAPVPQAYAAKYDAKNPSTYGTHQLATGPYMIKNDSSGKLTGYTPNKVIQLVRNPSWKASTDYKPAYLDSITIQEGNDATVAARKIESGSHMVSGDFQLPAPVLAKGKSLGSQFVVTPPTGRVRYVAMNTTVKPFDNINVRKAVVAAIDRNALRQAFGGPVTGLIPTHFIPPGIPGYDEAGGEKGPNLDFLSKPSGDMALARKYLKKAGYSSGKYTGGQPLLMVTDNATQQAKVAQVVQNDLQKLGFKVQLRAVTRDTMYTAYCNVPKKKVPICPSVGWLKDFPDPQTILDPTFNGKNILQSNNSNWPQLNDPKINAAMDKAELIQDPAQRAQAWGKIDDMVTAAAPAVPWLWDTQPMLQSKDVNGVVNAANASWDFTFTSVK